MWKEAFRNNPKLALALVPLIAGVVVLQTLIDPLRSQPAIEPANMKSVITGTKGGQLPGEFILGAFTGFRQVIAGLLWVRADSFFHQGNYDAILPLIRMITWLDPNWLDVYATGGWHLMYNFTDTDQRSDRRYLVPGLALLNEGIANNPDVYDIYKEKGWNNFDKVKDFAEAAAAYRAALAHDPKADTTQVMHALAHSLERAGDIEGAIKAWEDAIERHKKMAAASKDAFSADSQGVKNASHNLSMVRVRQETRKTNTQPPVDAGFSVKVKRLSPRVLEVSGTFNLIGTMGKPYFDSGTWDKDNINVVKIGKGLLQAGPRDGARVEIRLQDEGYKMVLPTSFDLQVDPSVTIMQEQASIRGGRQVRRGEPYVVLKKGQNAAEQRMTDAGIYGFTPEESATLGGVPVEKAMASNMLTPLAKRILVNLAYPIRGEGIYSDADIDKYYKLLTTDGLKKGDLTKQEVLVAQKDLTAPGKYSRKIDMGQDQQMYGFVKDKFELIIWFNPRTAPDFIQDRIGWNGEGLADKKYLVETTEPYPWIEHKGIDTKPVRMIQVKIPLTREQITGQGEATLFEG
ncbi:MAG: tetratricopeptide repeat protein [Armatimonas sp.]